MVYIFCAINAEAMCLESILTDDCTIVVTGVGKANVAYNVGKIIGNKTRADLSNDFVINFGCSCSKNLTGPFFINKITDISSGRDFYPDMIRIPGVSEASLYTSDVLVHNPLDNTLYDMEGSAFFECVSKHFSPDRIFLIKCVSDNGDLSGVSKESVKTACNYGVEYVKRIIDMNHPRVEVTNTFNAKSKLYITSTIETQLNELVTFSNSLGENIDSIFEKYIGDRDKLNKKETMEVINCVRQYLISY